MQGPGLRKDRPCKTKNKGYARTVLAERAMQGPSLQNEEPRKTWFFVLYFINRKDRPYGWDNQDSKRFLKSLFVSKYLGKASLLSIKTSSRSLSFA